MLAGLLVLATHVPLGQQVLRRGIVFIDFAVAQIAALGVIVADAIGWEQQGLRVQIAAIVVAMLGALLLTVVILGLWFGFKEHLGRAGFYMLFALALTATMQLVRVNLVFSSLIMPAIAVRN